MREWLPPPLPAGWAIVDQPFVAREPEVRLVLSAYSDVLSGSFRGVFVDGPPGMGKSRLIAESATRLSRLGAAVFAGSCVAEYGAPLEPLDTPLLQLLEAVRGPGASDPATRFLRMTISPQSVVGYSDRGEGRSGGHSSRLGSAIVELLGEAARGHPIVLVLDDLHWADATVLHLLPRLVSGLRNERVLFLAGARSTDPDRSEFADDVVAGLSGYESVRRIGLLPLTADDVIDYVKASTAAEPVSRVTEVGARLSYLTGGNPFLLREAWRHVVELADGSQEIALPETVNDLLRARLASIPVADRRTLETAAVLGMDVVVDELATLLGEPTTVVLDTLERAVSAGLVDAPRGGMYRFPHAIGRQALLDRIPARDLPGLHALAAATLQQLSPPPSRVTQRLAHHYAAAIPLGYRAQAVRYTALSGDLAATRVAYEEAARLYELAADLSEAAEGRNHLLIAAARNWHRAADFVRARTLAERVFEGGRPRELVQAALEFEEATWRAGVSGARAVELLWRALQSNTVELCGERIEALAALARAIALTGHTDKAREIAASATAQARARGDPDLLLRVLRRAYLYSLRPAGLSEAYERAGEVWTIGRLHSAELGEDLHAAPHFRSAAAYVLGDLHGFEEAESGLVTAAEEGGAFWRYWRECALFARHFIAGDLDQAQQASRRALEAEAWFHSGAVSTVSTQQLYMVKRERRELGVLRAVIRGDESPMEHWAPGLLGLYTELEMTRPAKRLLSWLFDHDRAEAHESAEWPAVIVLLTEAALFLGDQESLRRVRPLLAEYSGLNLLSGHSVGHFGAADSYLGQVDAALGTGNPADLFASALELDERLHAHLHAAHTRAATVRWLRDRNAHSREAAALAGEVRAEAERQGWMRVISVLDESSPGGGPAGLTPREREVLGLVDEGLSNHAIASRLFISEHTAANHIRNILTKTSSRSRSQAVRYARDAGLL